MMKMHFMCHRVWPKEIFLEGVNTLSWAGKFGLQNHDCHEIETRSRLNLYQFRNKKCEGWNRVLFR